MPQYYHDLITEKSYQFLQDLRRGFKFVLIGGWAVFAYSGALKSKDIDIVIDYQELGKLKGRYEVGKNERLRKYEIKLEGVDVDIYLPEYSDLGVSLDRVRESAINRRGFFVPQLEILFLLKLYAHTERQGSSKGRKDELDILSLAFLPEFNWREYYDLTKEFGLERQHDNFITLLKITRSVPEIGVNEQQMAKKRKKILEELKM